MRFGEQVLSTGTGFICRAASSRLCIVTNRHNVTGRRQDNDQPLSRMGAIPDNLVARIPMISDQGEDGSRKAFKLAWATYETVLHVPDGRPKWREHPSLGSRADFVALPLEDEVSIHDELISPTTPPPNLEIVLGPTDQVSIIGYPFGESAGANMAIWVNGTIASEPVVDYNEMPILLVDCRGRQGQSGSPVLAYRSGGAIALQNGNTAMCTGPVQNFVGIYSGRIRDDSDIGMIWKASAVRELLASV
nr:trypsin-like peptidase domain-containing protein [Burkholderia multivorans]